MLNHSLCKKERQAFESQLAKVLGIINHKLAQVPSVGGIQPRRTNRNQDRPVQGS
jgi:hypothetical protein